MSAIDDVTIALRFFGDDLDPLALTALLNVEPTTTYRKGEIHRGKRTGFTRIYKTGAWIYDRRYKELDVELAVKKVLMDFPDDLSLWRMLNDQFSVDLYLGLWMKATNEGFEMDVETSRMLSDRGLLIGFDVYCPLAEREDAHQDRAEP